MTAENDLSVCPRLRYRAGSFLTPLRVMQLDPRHLIQLATIVQCGSFSAAAAKLAMTQPALSKNMKKLEDRLKAPIFQRVGRQSVPTELGMTFAQYGLTILAAEEEARAYATHFSAGHAGTLLLGTTPSLADNFLAPFLADFLSAHEHCRIELRVGLLVHLEAQLSTGQVNLVIGPVRPSSENRQFETEALVDDTLGIVCRREHALCRQSEILPEHLEGQRWVAHSRGSYLRIQTEDALARFGVTRFDVALETDSTEVAYRVVAGSNLLTILPRLPSMRSQYADRISFVALRSTSFERPVGMIQRANHSRSALETAFVRSISQQFDT